MDKKLWIILIVSALVFAALLFSFGAMAFDSKLDPARLLAFFTGLLALATLLAATAIVAAFAQVREARKALRDNRAWNRMNAALTYIPSPALLHDWETRLDNSFIKLITRVEPLDKGDVRRLYEPQHADLRILLRAFLNILESYAIAVNCGIADPAIAKRFWGYKIVRHFRELWPYVEHARHVNNDNSLYGELEGLCKLWSQAWPLPQSSYPVEP